MLRNVTQAEWKTNYWFELVFDDGRNNGFGFPCDASGNILPGLPEAALTNLAYAKAHPEKFERYNEVVRYKNDYREPGRGTCSCGNTVVLENQYLGACQCSKCGKWYNLYGQELLPPECWEDDYD